MFLFGYSAKKMRQKINAALIHKGKDNCYVEITFTTGDEVFTIKRELLKGKSQYYIDKEPVSIAAVRVKMKYYNLDFDHNRFLILQGEIEMIAMMKPKDSKGVGLLEHLEDIIGTNVYKDKIDVLDEELHVLKEKESIVKSNYKFQEKEFNFIKSRNEENEKLLKQKVDWLKFKIKLNFFR